MKDVRTHIHWHGRGVDSACGQHRPGSNVLRQNVAGVSIVCVPELALRPAVSLAYLPGVFLSLCSRYRASIKELNNLAHFRVLVGSDASDLFADAVDQDSKLVLQTRLVVRRLAVRVRVEADPHPLPSVDHSHVVVADFFVVLTVRPVGEFIGFDCKNGVPYVQTVVYAAAVRAVAIVAEHGLVVHKAVKRSVNRLAHNRFNPLLAASL